MTPEEAQQLWVDALRSGEWQQTQALLRTDEGYCCLGVACELALRNGVPVSRRKVGDRWEYGEMDIVLPPIVQTWLGLASPEGNYEEDGEVFTLAERNDSGWSFDRIADIIEGRPQGLFK